ncbi:MAG: hypothetical protein R2788_06625 [Saprospiraceae bacterium]
MSALGSSTGADISYLWTALSGNLCGGNDDDGLRRSGRNYRPEPFREPTPTALFSTFCDVAVVTTIALARRG